MSDESITEIAGRISAGETTRVGAPELPEPAARPDPDGVTARERVFARWYVDTRNPLVAYRQAYEVAANAYSGAVYAEACEVLNRPAVRKLVLRLADERSVETTVKAVSILQDLIDIYEADPSELVRLEHWNCRHCHGVDHEYQWRDAEELARAFDRWQQQQAPGYRPAKGELRLARPSAKGGFGFTVKGEPDPACPHCFGEGVERVLAADTTKLSPKARKLLKSVEQKADGSIKFHVHDQMAARDMVVKMIGAYKEPTKFGGATAGEGDDPIPAGATQDQAAQAYMTMIRGGKQ
jgi:phage terminase small subunit